ncbi:hypothetical protein TGVAND_270940 [Toxoplasma gondii VAND]|uniref:Uncharacterized protein n=1 Tax=Toxoplasma gondii VAND TaxID=933077 RepID=A0A086PZR0_TOXGO|nr:hypothetical protein TGVAND_270940 [Toxoplasma gondii VAND]
MVVYRRMRTPATVRGPSSSEATGLYSFPSAAASDAYRILDSSDARRRDDGAQNRSHSLEVSREWTCVSEEVYPRFPALRSSKSFTETGSEMTPLRDAERASPSHHHRSLSFSRLLAKPQNPPSLFELIDGESLSASMEASAHPLAEEANDGEGHCEPVSSIPSSEQEQPYILPGEIGLRSTDAAWGDEALGVEKCGESDEGFACLPFAGLTKGQSTSWDYEAQGGSPATVLGVRDIQRLSGAARLHLSLLRKGEAEGGSCSAAAKSSPWALRKTLSTSSADGRRAPPGTTEATAELFVDLLQTLEAAGETMTKMEEQVSHHARRAEQLNARLERAVAHNDSMYAESEQLERRLRQAKAEVEALRSRCAGLEKKPDYRERYVASERGRAELERQVKQLQAQVDVFRAGAIKEQRQREEMEEEVSGIKKRLEEKEEQLLLTRRSLRSAVEQNSQLPGDSVPPQSSERRGRRSYFISGKQLHLGPGLSLASPRQLYRSPRTEALPPSPRPSPSSGGEARCVKCGCVSIPLLNVEGLSGSFPDRKQTARRPLSSAPLREAGRGQGDEVDEGHKASRGDTHGGREKVASLRLASGASFSTAPPTGREVPAGSDGVRSGCAESRGGFGLVEAEGEEEGMYDCGSKDDQENGEAPCSRQDAVTRTQRSLPSHCNSGRVHKAETVERHSTFSSFSFTDSLGEKRGADWADAVSPRRHPLVGEVCHNCRNETRGAKGSGEGRPSPLFSHVGETDSHRSASLSLGSSLPGYSLPSVRARGCPTPAAGDSGFTSSRGESTWRRLARSSASASYTLSSSPCRIASSGSALSFGSVSASPVDEGRENPSNSTRRLTSLCGNGRTATGERRGASGMRQHTPFSSIFSSGFVSDGTLDRRTANQPALSMFEELLQVGQSLTEEEARMKRTLDGLLAAVAASPVPFEELATKGLSKECLLKIRKLRQNAPKNSHATRPAGGFFSPVLYPLLSFLFDSQRLRCSDTGSHRLLLARVKALPRAVLHFLLAGFFRESRETKQENEGDAVASDAEAPSSASSSPASSTSSLPASSAAVWPVVKTLLAHVRLGGPASPSDESTSAGGTEDEAESTGRRAMRRQKTQRASGVSSSTGGRCSGGEDHGVEQNADHGQVQRKSTEVDTLFASEPAKRAGLVLLLAFLASTFFSAIELPLGSASPLAPSGL